MHGTRRFGHQSTRTEFRDRCTTLPRASDLTVVVSEIGERRLLELIRARLVTRTRRTRSILVDVGDDAAVVAPTRNAQTVLTTDALIEGVHFERRFGPPVDIGHRALAVNLSDLAAMGAAPRWALLSLVLPDTMPVHEVEEIVNGMVGLAATHGVDVIGGNITRSPGPLMIDVTAVGEAMPRRVLTRSGGRPGDAVYVSGTVGGAAAGLDMLRSGAGDHEADPRRRLCIDKYRRPEPRVKLGRAVAHARAARAAIDLSDGLADAGQGEGAPEGGEVGAGARGPTDDGARRGWGAGGGDPRVAGGGGGATITSCCSQCRGIA